MRKTLMISSVLALGLGAAGAQTATTTASAQVTQFSDVPAGHWAKDAVDKIVSCGLIQGFPDGTYRGNENLTRYQAALIFHRLLTTDALSKCGFSQGDMTTIVNGMQSVSTELAAISTRVGDLEKANADQQARIAALEEKINGLTAGAGGADVTALTARVDALETAIKNIPAGPQGPKGDKGDKGDKGEPGAAAVVTAPAATTAPVTTAPTTVVIGSDSTPNMAMTSNYYAGLDVGAKMTDVKTVPCTRGKAPNISATGYCLTVGGQLGAKSVFGPIGARVAVAYTPGYNGISADVAATYSLDTGSNLGVYAGAGLGITSSQARAATSGTTTGTASDVYALGLLGVEYRVTDNIAAYVEGNGRYYLSNKGAGTGLATTNTAAGANNSAVKGFNGAVKAGVKFYF